MVVDAYRGVDRAERESRGESSSCDPRVDSGRLCIQEKAKLGQVKKRKGNYLATHQLYGENAPSRLWKHLRILKVKAYVTDNEVSELIQECGGLLGFRDGVLESCEMIYEGVEESKHLLE